jgi:anti-sigma B factor antagonist
MLEQLRFEPHGEVLLARLSGEVDLSNVFSVREQLLAAVPNTATSLVLDLSDTAYIDSSGVRLIFELAQRMRVRGQKLELVVPDDSFIKRVLLLTQVERVVPIAGSIEELMRD